MSLKMGEELEFLNLICIKNLTFKAQQEHSRTKHFLSYLYNVINAVAAVHWFTIKLFDIYIYIGFTG